MEIVEIELLGRYFMFMFKQSFPSEHVSLKMHLLETHVPEFAHAWGTIGLVSEDSAESIHALLMKLERRYACMLKARKEQAIHHGLLAAQATSK